jgi:hypothetical protein
MLIVYFPGSSRWRGKLYWPWALLTTQVVIVEPAFFAPTITPSIAPSACEVTLPVSAESEEVWAVIKPARVKPSKTVSMPLVMIHSSLFKLLSSASPLSLLRRRAAGSRLRCWKRRLRPKNFRQGCIGAHLILITAANANGADQLILHNDRQSATDEVIRETGIFTEIQPDHTSINIIEALRHSA